jgi:hypothetical protein
LSHHLLKPTSVVGERLRLDEVVGIADVDVPLGLLVVRGNTMAHELVGAGATDTLNAEGEAGMLEGGSVALADEFLEQTIAETFLTGLLPGFLRAALLIAQERGGHDGPRGLGGVVEECYVHA